MDNITKFKEALYLIYQTELRFSNLLLGSHLNNEYSQLFKKFEAIKSIKPVITITNVSSVECFVQLWAVEPVIKEDLPQHETLDGIKNYPLSTTSLKLSEMEQFLKENPELKPVEHEVSKIDKESGCPFHVMYRFE